MLVLIDKQEGHFNELYRLISKRNKRFSKPTFNTHLKHLMTAGYVTRTPEKGQLVTYSLNLEKIGKMKEYSERVKRIVKSEYESKEEFFSLTEKEQVSTLLDFLSLRKLNEIKAQIEYGLDPESFEKWFAVRFWAHPALERVTVWMIKKCVEDEVYRKNILKIIDDILEK
jgi:DNA-binding transcriptional ArsR family regulator